MSQAFSKNQNQKPPSLKFGGLPPNAMSQFTLDLLGVWAPKIPITRSKQQLFEDAFLENVENGAFYFSIPLMAPLFAHVANWISEKAFPNGKKLTNEMIGSSWNALGTKAEQAGVKLIGAKAATLIAVLGFAGGYEYLIQHVKNMITAAGFKTKNFAAVAGLEDNSNVAASGEVDPVVKAKHRLAQVGGIMAGSFGLAAATPILLRQFPALLKPTQKVLKFVNFNSTKNAFFDITKPILAVIAGIGAFSYVDAARDGLERKETGSRLMMVIPFMLFGKELAGNLLGKVMMNYSKIDVGQGNETKLKSIAQLFDEYKVDGKALSFLENENIFSPKVLGKKFISADSPMKLDLLHGEQYLVEGLKKTGMSDAIKSAILRKHAMLGIGSLLLSALINGLGINWLSYEQTKARFKRQHTNTPVNQPESQKVDAAPAALGQPLQPVPLAPGQIVHQSYGGFAAQGKPLEDPSSLFRSAARFPQSPFPSVRPVQSPFYPYGAGQWRI